MANSRLSSCRPFSDMKKKASDLGPVTKMLLSDYLSLIHQLDGASPKASAAIQAACKLTLGHLEALIKMMTREPSEPVLGIPETEAEDVEELLAAARDILERHPTPEE